MDNPYRAPQGQIYTPTAGTPKTWKEIFFSFEGRIPRRTYWGATLIMLLITMVPVLIVMFATDGKLMEGSGLIFLIPVYLVVLYVSIAISVKRWHDRNKSGWWYLIGLVPYIGGIWAFIENGCLRGTEGPNNYGEDPT